MLNVVAVALGACVMVQALALALRAQDPPNKQSIWDGVYTEQQAKRGETTYGRACEACHGADLSGDPVKEVPSLVWDSFLARWSDRSVKDLYETIKRSMPRDAPGSLNARAYADVIAYMFQSNKIPAGMKELSLNPEAQALIVIERQKQ